MMKRLYPLIITIPLLFVSVLGSTVAKADIFGGDVAVLAQILTETVEMLAVLRQTLDVAKGDDDLLHQVNRDINTALTEINSMQDLVRDTTAIGKVKDPTEILLRLQDIYGRLPKIGNTTAMQLNDFVSGTSFGVDNDTHNHARKIDEAALTLQRQAQSAGPGKAQQLQAQASAVQLNALAQLERSTATLVRLQATELAMRNEDRKNHVDSFEQSFSQMAQSGGEAQENLELKGLN